MMLPTAPIPVHTAYAVPNGSDLSASAISPKLSAIATRVAAVGQNRVSPSEYFRPNAQAISSNPAATNASHPLTVSPAPAEASARRIEHNHGTGARTSDWRRMRQPWPTARARDRRTASHRTSQASAVAARELHRAIVPGFRNRQCADDPGLEVACSLFKNPAPVRDHRQ